MMHVVVEDERGKVVEELTGSADGLNDLLARCSGEEFVLLPFVDPYGDTVFNRLQIPSLIRELRRLRETTTPRELDLLDRLDRLVNRCQEDVHLYLRFLGD
ncbi:MAG: hypothetical protein AAB131_10115 [Actinomycetota bacterium]